MPWSPAGSVLVAAQKCVLSSFWDASIDPGSRLSDAPRGTSPHPVKSMIVPSARSSESSSPVLVRLSVTDVVAEVLTDWQYHR